jgi:hypothetical protein
LGGDNFIHLLVRLIDFESKVVVWGGRDWGTSKTSELEIEKIGGFVCYLYII